MTSFKSKWVESLRRNRAFYREGFDSFENWERNSAVESRAEHNLLYALDIAYADGDPEWTRRFLRSSVAMVDRALREGRFESEQYEGGFPMNRGRGLRARAYASALLTNRLPTSDLQEAIADYVQWCRQDPDPWDSMLEAFLLNAVRMALVLGETDQAEEILKMRRRIKWHAEEAALEKHICAAARRGVPIEDDDLRADFRAFFDRVRDFDYRPDIYFEDHIARFELAILWQRYFCSAGQIDWDAVIEAVSE